MGAPIARHLAAAGHEVRAWNRTCEKAEGLGAEVADSPAAAVEGAEVVITMLADGPTVDSVNRAAGPGWSGGIWAQTSTVGMDWTHRLAALADEKGVAYVDAPVLGTRKPAEDGTLVVLLSGRETRPTGASRSSLPSRVAPSASAKSPVQPRRSSSS